MVTTLTLLTLCLLSFHLVSCSEEQQHHHQHPGVGWTCTQNDISFFKSLQCADGQVGMSSSCACSNTKGGDNCELKTLRIYLPERSIVDATYYNKHVNFCDKMFALAFSKHLRKTRRFEKRRGYPQDCPKDKEGECHRPSLGKFIRYNSLMEFHGYRGSTSNDTLYDIFFPTPFRWAASVPLCKSDDDTKNYNWGCAFQPLSHSLGTLEEGEETAQLKSPLSNYAHTEAIDILMPQVDVLRRQGSKDHVSQLILYSRLLYLLRTPSAIVRDYMNTRTKTLNPQVAQTQDLDSHTNGVIHGHVAGSTLLQHGSANLSDPLRVSPGVHVKPPPTVSMHVRQGDSCDFMLNQTVKDMTHYLQKDANDPKKSPRRPCFSVDVYMSALHELREQYGSTRVLLSTDSAEMLQRIETEKTYTWVLVNTSVDAYQARSGPFKYIDFLPSSANEAVLLGGASDLHLLSHGDIFLGAFSSHFSKLIYLSMVGHHLRVLPFHSLDYPLSCDTSDDCTLKDIKSRGMTMERIAMWAPECIRGVLPWSPSNDRDPCGIYLA